MPHLLSDVTIYIARARLRLAGPEPKSETCGCIEHFFSKSKTEKLPCGFPVSEIIWSKSFIPHPLRQFCYMHYDSSITSLAIFYLPAKVQNRM